MPAAARASFLPRQFENRANVEAHALGTGPEILAQLAALGLAPDAFVAGVGTGGTVMGTGAGAARGTPAVRDSPGGTGGVADALDGAQGGVAPHPGVSDEFIPQIVDLAELDRVLMVSDGDSILMAQKLAARLGLGLGISSGLQLPGGGAGG